MTYRANYLLLPDYLELALPVSELSANSEAQKRAWKVRKQGRRSA